MVFSEQYHPGWKATVDGKPVPVWKANYAFRGIVVPAGEHTIRMHFEPWSFHLGLRISLFTVILILVLSVLNTVRSAIA